MSNKTQLQTNNTALDALITRVNAAKDVAASLPEAGGATEDLDTELTTQENLISQWSTVLDSKASGGSGDGSVETCTVNINFSNSISGYGIFYATNVDSDGIYTYAEDDTKSSGETVTINPLCNSIITITHPVDTADCDAGTILLVSTGNGLVYQTPITNVVATINFEGI